MFFGDLFLKFFGKKKFYEKKEEFEKCSLIKKNGKKRLFVKKSFFL